MKACGKCGALKPVSQFHRSSRRSDGMQFACKACNNKHGKEWYANNKDKARDATRLNRYGVSRERFDELLALQENACAICRRIFRDSKSTHVDHSHECCKGITSCGSCVRSLLCDSCNWILGNAKDDCSVLASAMEYLMKHGGCK